MKIVGLITICLNQMVGATSELGKSLGAEHVLIFSLGIAFVGWSNWPTVVVALAMIIVLLLVSAWGAAWLFLLSSLCIKIKTEYIVIIIIR